MIMDNRLIFLIFSAQQKLRIYLNNALSAAGGRVTVAQAGILFLLTELSQILGIDNSTMTGLTDRLEKAGFAKRQASTGDRRASHIHITSEGLAEVEGAKRVIRQVNEEIKTGFSEEEIEAFKRVLNGFFDKFQRNGNAKNQSPASMPPPTTGGNKGQGMSADKKTR